MENTLIKSVNKDFSKYEELLLRRDNLKKKRQIFILNTFAVLVI